MGTPNPILNSTPSARRFGLEARGKNIKPQAVTSLPAAPDLSLAGDDDTGMEFVDTVAGLPGPTVAMGDAAEGGAAFDATQAWVSTFNSGLLSVVISSWGNGMSMLCLCWLPMIDSVASISQGSSSGLVSVLACYFW